MDKGPDNPSVLITGIGEVGSHLLEFLARDNSHINIVAADTNLHDVEAKVNNALFGAVLHNCFPDVKSIEIDLFDIERTASILNEIQPDVVVNCAVLQTWHVIRRLPEDIYSRLITCLDMKSALAGATRMASAQRASSIWPIAASAPVSSKSVATGLPDRAWKVSGVTNSVAERVMTTRTSAPSSRRRRTISALL